MVVLAFSPISYDERGSKNFGGTFSLHLRESSPCLLRLNMEKVLTGCLIVPKVPNFPGGYPKFLEVLLCD